MDFFLSSFNNQEAPALYCDNIAIFNQLVLYQQFGIPAMPYDCGRIIRVVKVVGDLFVVIVDAAFDDNGVLLCWKSDFGLIDQISQQIFQYSRIKVASEIDGSSIQ